MTTLDDWSENQDKIDGYINYKGNHDMAMPYTVVKPRILEHAQQQIDNNIDVQINHFKDSIPKKGILSVIACEIIFLKNDR